MRQTIAWIAAAVFGLYLLVVAIGIPHDGTFDSLGRRVEVRPQVLRYASVTNAGHAAGLRQGDVVDVPSLSIGERVAWWNHVIGDQSVIPLTVERRGQPVTISIKTRSLTAQERVQLSLGFGLILASYLFGLALLFRSNGRRALVAGIMVVAFGVASAEDFSFSAWAAPLPIQVFLLIVQIWALSIFGIAAVVLGGMLLPPSIKPALRASFTAFPALCAIGVAIFWSVDYTLWLFTGITYFNGQYIYREILSAEYISIIALFGIAAALARGNHAAPTRMLFVSTFVSLGSACVLQLAPLLNHAWYGTVQEPLYYCMEAAQVIAFAGFTYAFLSRHLLAIDFVINRAVVFGSLIFVVGAILVVVEKLIERYALESAPGFALELAATLLVALSFRWLESKISDIVERIFYRDRLRASRDLDALIDDFPFLPDVRGLADRLVRELVSTMKATSSAVYLVSAGRFRLVAVAGNADAYLREIDETDDLLIRVRSTRRLVQARDFRTSMPAEDSVFPLALYGTVVGVLSLGRRENGEAFDPEEQALIQRVAHEFAGAVTWLTSAESHANDKIARLSVG